MTLSNSLSSNTRIHVTRLTPGTDLKKALQLLAVRNNWSAAVMVTCVGSLVECNLRFANQKEGTHKKGHFEIVSLTGTLSASSVHVHLAASDEKGVIIGGHLLDGNIVFTTVEVAIAELSDLAFERQFDPASGYQELHIVGR